MDSLVANTTSNYGEVEVDWFEDDSGHIFKFNLPGLRANDVKVQLVNEGTLQVSGVRPQSSLLGMNQKWHVKERPYGAFSRTFRIPTSVRLEDVKAVDLDGVLIINVPKNRLVRNIPVF